MFFNPRSYMKHLLSLLLLAASLILVACEEKDQDPALAEQIEQHLRQDVLDKWYPLAMDTVDGGFLSTFSFDFRPVGEQEKMIVTQSRHVWTNAKAAERYPEVDFYAA